MRPPRPLTCLVLLLSACGRGAETDTPADTDDTDVTDTDACEPIGAESCGNGIDDDCVGGDALCSVASDGWTMTAGAAEDGEDNGMVTGSFTLDRTEGAEARSGGACLVADLVGRGVGAASCTTDDDCVVDADQAALGWWGYCGHPEGSGEPNQCWTRPGGISHCLRSIDTEAGAFEAGTYDLPEVVGDVFDDGEPVRWAVLACLAHEAYPGGCGSGDSAQYVRVTGPSWTFIP